MAYRMLEAEKIIGTLESLQERIDQRFPGSGLGQVCEEVTELARGAEAAAEELRKPIIALRIGLWLLIFLLVGGLIGLALQWGRSLDFNPGAISFPELVQMLEAATNELVLIGIAVVFMITWERRIKRRRALRAIHELRSLAHIVDMHQLTKDPAHRQFLVEATSASPERGLSPAQLSRYLDYCTEMLSLIGKIAALFAERFDDSVVLSSVNEVEILTATLSQKIWQKLTILESPGGMALGQAVPLGPGATVGPGT